MADGGCGPAPAEAMRAVIVAAALHYRDTMRRYLGEQTEAIASGEPLDALVADNWGTFQEAVRAEERLFALLDTLEAIEAETAGAGGEGAEPPH
jgi:hypothetical protein